MIIDLNVSLDVPDEYGDSILRAIIARLSGGQMDMVQTRAVVLTAYAEMPDASRDFGIKAAITNSTVSYGGLGVPSGVPAIGDLAVALAYFRSDDLTETLTNALPPTLAASSSPNFLIALQTQGVNPSNAVWNFNSPLLEGGRDALAEWFDEWYGSEYDSVIAAISPETTRIQAILAIIQAVNPGTAYLTTGDVIAAIDAAVG